MNKLICYAIIGVVSITIAACDRREAMGSEVVRKVEEFRKKNNRVPQGLNEIGITEKEEGPIYYKRISSEEYEVYYGLVLGESRIYSSKTKRWD